MARGSPDFHAQTVPIKLPEGLDPAGFYLNVDILEKPYEDLVTTYLKEACVVMPYVTVASPLGMMASYEGGYVLRALISKAGAGEVALAKNCLDTWAALQNANGSWYQQYYPYRNAADTFPKYEARIVDSCVALIAWAMADYDASVGAGSTVYKAYVQLAYNWLRLAQSTFQAEHVIGLLCNQKLDATWNMAALAADCAEVLLASNAVLDQYGDALTNQAGYSIKTFANDLYSAMCGYLWTGDAYRYYRTEYPAAGKVWGLPTVKQNISFTQALCAMAVYEWYNGAHNTQADYTAQCEKALDKATSILAGKWGGYIYCPYTGLADENRNEFPTYAAHMVLAMDSVNCTKYANQISRARRFIQLAALRHGEVADYVLPNGRMDIGVDTAYGFLALNSALGLLAGA